MLRAKGVPDQSWLDVDLRGCRRRGTHASRLKQTSNKFKVSVFNNIVDQTRASMDEQNLSAVQLSDSLLGVLQDKAGKEKCVSDQRQEKHNSLQAMQAHAHPSRRASPTSINRRLHPAQPLHLHTLPEVQGA